VRKAASLLANGEQEDVPETFGYSVKRRLLGPPMITAQLKEERLSKPLALGVLSCDGISSANYGSELILYSLLPFFGLTAFTLLMPLGGPVPPGRSAAGTASVVRARFGAARGARIPP